jgi:serine/threonine protein kinase
MASGETAMTEREMFEAALEQPPENWGTYLDRVCEGDEALRQRLRVLLSQHEQAGSFLEKPVLTGLATLEGPAVSERAGTVIGHYKLLEQIGEGGFGIVFMAEQMQPIRRKVALKVLKPGMDTRQVVARFEGERQALAIMDHPHIAKVFDGGATASGRPYFVMELVKGVPITVFCDQNHMAPRQRLELFVPVCQAVQHAHQKGIIHRDLKPSNILVVVHDTTPVVKVIDFGVAKALGQELTDKTLFTGFAQMIGTPLYMSPEQAGQSGLDIDTRSDIYSLGVLLYELLTSTTPFVKERFKQAAYDEIRRIIREEEPPRPSTRLAQSTQTLASVAAQRHTEPAKLTRLIRGELDWIVMKCLEKDRNRRYETPGALSQDIERYLHDEPVEACPPSAMYRFRKFIRRNKVAIALSAVICVALIAVTVACTVAYRNEQRRLADQSAHEGQLQAERRQSALDKGLMAAMSSDFNGAEKSIDEAELLGAAIGQVRMLRGQVAFHRGDMGLAIQHLEQARRLLPVGQDGAVAARAMLALAYLNAFRFARFTELWKELDQLSPITPEDFLFKGLLMATSNPERGLQTLDEGIRRHDSILARATRLEARANRAMFTGKVNDAELALEDAQVARSMLGGNALVLARSVIAHLVAATCYEAEGRPKDSQRVLGLARPMVEELTQFSAIPFAAKVCFEYFEYVGDEEAAYAMSGRANQFRRAVMLYRRGEFAKALEVAVERFRSGAAGPTEHIERALIVAELPDGPARARAAFQEIRAASSTWPLAPPAIFLLLGKPEEARQAWLQISKEDVPTWFDGWWLKFWDYNCGRITTDQLLQSAGQDRGKLSTAHFVIGLWRLSEGDRIAAQEHFRKCVATGGFESWHWPWVRAFLARMETDPAWPPWIPLKKE